MHIGYACFFLLQFRPFKVIPVFDFGLAHYASESFIYASLLAVQETLFCVAAAFGVYYY